MQVSARQREPITGAPAGAARAARTLGATGAARTLGATTGPSRSLGAAGAARSPGLTGAVRSLGVTGAARSLGATGAARSLGAAGAARSLGATSAARTLGTIGAARSLGATGAARSLGATGAAPRPGATGAARSLGAAGAARSLGATSAARTLGTIGAARSLGATGAARPPGARGAARSLSATGTARSLGATGAARSLGAAGPARSLGATDTARSLGATGAARPLGARCGARPRRHHRPSRSLGATGAIAVIVAAAAAAACGSRSAPARDEEAAAPNPTAAAGSTGAGGPSDAGDAGAAPGDAAGNRITLSVEPPRRPGGGLARRCTLGGDPLTGACIGGTRGIAIDRDGVLHVAAGTAVQRYRRGDGDGACHYEPAGPALELPPVPERKQRIDGPVFMRSGGPEWRLSGAAGAVYAIDYLGGLHRVGPDRVEPVCPDVYGYKAVVPVGKDLVVHRGAAFEAIDLGRGAKRCTTRRRDDLTRLSNLHAAGERLYGGASGHKLVRVDGAERAPLAEGTRICTVTAVVACGEGTCVFDHNCMQLIQLDAADRVQRTLDDRKLFPARPWALHDALTTAAGDVLVLASHRDKVDGGEVCEPALYELPAALFAP